MAVVNFETLEMISSQPTLKNSPRPVGEGGAEAWARGGLRYDKEGEDQLILRFGGAYASGDGGDNIDPVQAEVITWVE